MPVAPYQRAIEVIRNRIADGTWPPGHQVPSRAVFAAETGLSEASVRRGMEILRKAGVLEGTARSRLWVAHPPAVRTLLTADFEWPYRFGDAGTAGTSRATEEMAARLGVSAGVILHWETRECLDPDLRPSHLVTTWRRTPRLKQWARCLAEVSHREMAVDEAQALGLPAGTFVWLVQRIRITSGGVPVEAADLVLPVDRWRLRLS